MLESLIAAGAALLVCLINNWYMDKRHGEKEAATIAVITTKLEDLTKQVEKHNGVLSVNGVQIFQGQVLHLRVPDLVCIGNCINVENS